MGPHPPTSIQFLEALLEGGGEEGRKSLEAEDYMQGKQAGCGSFCGDHSVADRTHLPVRQGPDIHSHIAAFTRTRVVAGSPDAKVWVRPECRSVLAATILQMQVTC